MLGVRPLVLIGFLSAFLLMVYYTYSPSAAYPMQNVTKEEVLHSIEQFVLEHDLDHSLIQGTPLVETQANESIGRYVDQAGWSYEEIEEASQEVPFYDIVVVYDQAIFYVDPLSNEVNGADGIELMVKEKHEIDEWVHSIFGPSFIKDKQMAGQNDDTLHIYRSGKVIGDIEEQLRVNVSYGDTIVGLKRYGEVEGYALKEEVHLGEGISFLLFFGTLLVVLIAVTIQVIRRLFINRIEVVLLPILIGLLAGFGWVITSYIALGKFEPFSMFFAIVMTYLTSMILILKGKKEDYQASIRKKVAVLKPAIINGFLLMIISTLLVEIFYLVSSRFGVWASPVMDYAIFLNAPLYALPFFALFMGVSAAITEEAIFRRYLIPVFDRMGVVLSIMITSYLWSIGHVGYHMFPWYIRIIEFVIIVGPIFYIIYKRYGFLTAIFCHFFYNSFFGSIFLLGLDLRVGLVSFLFAISPFAILFFKQDSEEAKAIT